MKKDRKLKLKLTKSTIADLDRIKGGRPPCACQVTTTNAANNYMYTMPVTCRPTCLHDILTNCY
jgi:hypothetical protein